MGTSLDPKDNDYIGNLIISDTSLYNDGLIISIEASNGLTSATGEALLIIGRSPN